MAKNDEQELLALFKQLEQKAIDISELNEAVKMFYDQIVLQCQDSLKEAFVVENQLVKKHDFKVMFMARSDLNAGTMALNSQSSLLWFSGALPYLLFAACYIYSCRVDVTTVSPFQQNGKVVSFKNKLQLVGKLQQTPTDASHILQLFDNLMSSEQYPSANVEMAFFLYELAARFITMHEIMHIVLGHTAYVKRECSLDMLFEFSEEREEKLDEGFSQCLEFIADRHSSRGILAKLLNNDYDSELMYRLLKHSKLTKEEVLVRYFTMAMTITLHLFPARDHTLYSLYPSHPHPYTRMQWICQEVGHELDEVDLVGGKLQCGESNNTSFKDHLKLTLFECLAETTTTLTHNFETPNSWLYALSFDVDERDQRSAEGLKSNLSYENILALSKRWQSYIYRGYSPAYVGDGTGRI